MVLQVICPHCHSSVEYLREPPSFCAYCGSSLQKHELAATAVYEPGDATLVPAPPYPGPPMAMPQRVGDYKLVRPVGTGGMGTVYDAEDIHTGRHVALKLIAPEFARSPDAIERFRTEGKLASTISHPRVVFVMAADEEAGRPYIVMELMTGCTLRDLVEKQGPLPVAEAITKIFDVIDGLQEAHQWRVVHRDVKPSNCFIEPDGHVKVGDFGLAKSLLGDGHLTKTGSFVGTPLFASPEQVRGRPVDQQTDVYSVAATLYYLLTGRSPFEKADATPTEILARIMEEEAPSMRAFQPDLSRGLDQVVRRGLEKDPKHRYRTVAELRAALLPYLPGQLAVGGLGQRLGAYLVDFLVLLPVYIISRYFCVVCMEHDRGIATRAIHLGIDVLAALTYFGIMEGRWGYTVGKRLMRLRVARPKCSDPPGVPAAVLRFVIFYCMALLPNDFLQYFTHYDSPVALALATSAGAALVLCTMRPSNGYRGLHEILSDTRVVRLPPKVRRVSYQSRSFHADLEQRPELPERLGAYHVKGALFWLGEFKIVLADDPTLEREVWIWLRPKQGLSLPPARRDVSRATRLRWLAQGTFANWQWDAFAAAPGCLLADFIAEHGRMNWTEARPILEQLLGELTAGLQDGTFPRMLTVSQVWVQPNGRVQLMGAPAKESFLELAEQDGLSDDERALKFLRHISVLLLEGKRRPVKCALLPVSAPLPSHASAFLNHLLGVTTPYATVVEVEKNLSETRDQPSEVTSQLRAAHLSLWGVAHIMGIFIMLFASRLYSLEAMADLGMDVIRAEATLRVDDKRVFGADFLKQMDLRRGSQPITELRAMLKDRLMRDRRELQLRLQSLNWLARAVFDSMESHNLRVLFLGEQPLAIVPHSDDTMRVTAQRDDVTVQFDRDDFHLALEHLRSQFNYSAVEEPWHLYVTILFFPMIWVVWAFLFRGGVTQWLVGIEVRRKNGQPAARWQCALRSALVWLPVAGLLCLVVRIDTWSWSYSAAESAAWWLPWAAVVLWWIAIFVLLLYAALALRFPSRGPHDRLAGTWLVPR